MSELVSCVSVYSTHQTVEYALAELDDSEFDLRQVSLVCRDHPDDTRPAGFYTDSNEHHYLGPQASFWNAVWERLTGAGIFWLPEHGTLVVAGPLVSLLVKRLEGYDISPGPGVLGSALFSMGIPMKNIKEYEQSVESGELLLTVHGQRQAVESACKILHGQERQVMVHTARR